MDKTTVYLIVLGASVAVSAGHLAVNIINTARAKKAAPATA